MQLLKFIPIKLTLCLVLGILLGKYFQLGIIISSIPAVFFLALLSWSFYKGTSKKSILFGVLVVLTTISTGMLSTALAIPENHNDHFSNQISKQNTSWRLKILEVMKPTPFATRYVARVQSNEDKITSGKVLLNFYSISPPTILQVDDELLVLGRPELIKPPLNPYQFDYKKYLADLGITHQFTLDRSEYLLSKNPSKTLYGVAAGLRNSIISKLDTANFGVEELSIIQALLLGQRNDIAEDTYNNYKNAGAVHILAVSGLHIGILLLLLQFLLRPLELLPHGKKLKLFVVVILLWAFAFLAGFSASIIRAVTMFTFVAYAMYLNRPSNTFNILALSIFFILLVVNPFLLFSVGFQMSYAAVFAIVWIYPLFQKLWYPQNWFFRKVWQLLSVSVAAQFGVLPISLFYFHQFPGLFFVSNLLIVPFLGLVLGVGILVILLSLFNILPDMLVKFYNFLIGLMNDVIGWVAQQEAFVFQNIPFDWVQLLLGYAVFICLVLVFQKATFKRMVILLAALIGIQIWVFFSAYRTAQKTHLLLAHQTRISVLMHQNGNQLSVLTNEPDKVRRMVTDYQVGERIASIAYQNLENSYTFKQKKIVLLDSLGVFPSEVKHVDYLLMTQSPKINLERLIDSLKPKHIIVDGSNYRSYVNRWKLSCAKRKLPFHYTGEKGAYYFDW